MGQQPGVNAGKLELGVWLKADETDDTKALAKSAGFSVAAIPDEIQMHNLHAIPDDSENRFKIIDMKTVYRYGFGAVYDVTYKSDSTVQGDLDAVMIQEKIVPVDATGQMTKGTSTVTGKAQKGTKTDTQDVTGRRYNYDTKGKQVTRDVIKAVIASLLIDKKEGSTTDNQYFIFSDARTGATDVKVPKSGFKIVMEFKKDTDGKWKFFVTKTPLANNGVQAGGMPPAATVTFIDPVEE
jgi:hypothetical protein